MRGRPSSSSSTRRSRKCWPSYGLLRWAFWLLELAIDICSFAYLIGAQHSENDRDRNRGTRRYRGGRRLPCRRAGRWLRPSCWTIAWTTPRTAGSPASATSLPQPKIAAFRLLLPGLGDASPGRANFALLQLFKEMRRFQSTLCRGQSWHWRPSPLSPKHELFKVTRKILNASPVYPRVRPDRRKHIGFIVPLAEFGGVEKTAYNLARVMRDNGWSTHLFVFCKQAAQPASLICDVFDSLNFLCDPQVGHWDPEIRYMGSHYPSWVAVGRHSRAMGLLCGLDVVANFHCAEAHALMAPLRRCGAKTIASLHVTDLDAVGQAEWPPLSDPRIRARLRPFRLLFAAIAGLVSRDGCPRSKAVALVERAVIRFAGGCGRQGARSAATPPPDPATGAISRPARPPERPGSADRDRPIEPEKRAAARMAADRRLGDRRCREAAASSKICRSTSSRPS